MNTAIKTFIKTVGIPALLLLANICYAQDTSTPICATAIGKTALYSLTTSSPSGPVSISTFWNGKSGSTQITHDLKGIATWGNYAFVTDVGDTSQLHVMHLGTGYLYTIDLPGVASASAVSVDGVGNVYVADAAQNSAAQLAILSSANWSSPGSVPSYYSIQQPGVKGNNQVDVAGYVSASEKNVGAALLSRATDTTGVELSDLLPGAGVIHTSVLSATGKPRAITTDNNGNEYSLYTKLDINGITTSYILATLNGSLKGSCSFEGTGTDISWIAPDTIGGQSYISVLGDSSSSKFTNWIVGLTNGIPGGVTSRTISDAASTVGIGSAGNSDHILWAASKQDGSIYGISTTSWASSLGVSVGDDTIAGISSHKYVESNTQIPEPSSLISLLVASIGVLGYAKKRK